MKSASCGQKTIARKHQMSGKVRGRWPHRECWNFLLIVDRKWRMDVLGKSG